MPYPDLDPHLSFAKYAATAVVRHVERLGFLVEKASRSPKEETVHQLRVSSRRLVSALNAFGGNFPKRGSAKVRKRANRLRSAAGAVRDHDIALALADEVGVPLTEQARENISLSRLRAAQKLGERVERMAEKSVASKWTRALRLDQNNERPDPGPAAGSYAAAILPKMADEYFQSGHEAAAPAASIDELHAFRILGKRFRYTLELFVPCYGGELKDALRLLRGLQDILGMVNDCETAVKILKKAVSKRQQAEVETLLEQRKMALVENFRSHWQETFSDDAERLVWMKMLARPAFAPASDSGSNPDDSAVASTA